MHYVARINHTTNDSPVNCVRTEMAKFKRVFLQLLDADAQVPQIKWPEGTTLSNFVSFFACNRPAHDKRNCPKRDFRLPSRRRRESALSGNYAAYSGNSLPTFRDNLSGSIFNGRTRYFVPIRRDGITTIRRVTLRKSTDLNFLKFVSERVLGLATVHAPVTSSVSRNKCHKPVSSMLQQC